MSRCSRARRVALALMLALWFGMGAEKGAAVIQGMLLNMAVRAPCSPICCRR